MHHKSYRIEKTLFAAVLLVLTITADTPAQVERARDGGNRTTARASDRSESFRPPGAVDFAYDTTIDVNGRIVEDVEFTQQRCNITLRNRTGAAADVDVAVCVLNADGVVLDVVRELWMVESLAPEQKYLASLPLELKVPATLLLSRDAESFSLEPVSFVVFEEPASGVGARETPARRLREMDLRH